MAKIKIFSGGEAYILCPACNSYHAVRVPPHQRAWGFNNDVNNPTLMPSVKVTGGFPHMTCHSFVECGRINFLGDCSHGLRGWHDLLEIDDRDFIPPIQS